MTVKEKVLVKRKCVHCHNTFIIIPKRGRKQIYCSSKCFRNRNRKPLTAEQKENRRAYTKRIRKENPHIRDTERVWYWKDKLKQERQKVLDVVREVFCEECIMKKNYPKCVKMCGVHKLEKLREAKG